MKSILFIIASILTITITAQKLNPEFGNILRSEISMKSYEKDRASGAVNLFDIGETKFINYEGGYNIQFKRHKRIKIFKESEFNLAEVTIPFYEDGYGKKERVKDIKAVTYNYENGNLKEQELDYSLVFEEKLNDRWSVKKFVLPNVKAGSILDIEYTMITPFHQNLPDWRFQDVIPTIYSEYEVSMIPFYEYAFILQGISKFDYQNSEVSKIDRKWGNVAKSFGRVVGGGVEFNDYIHTYVLKDVPAFKDESYISSVNDYILKMDFQLAKFNSPNGTSNEIITTWEELNKELLKHPDFGKYINSSKKIAKKKLSSIEGISKMNDLEKSKAIIGFVKRSFSWNKFNSKYSSQSPKEFYKNKIGNKADINLFLIAMLAEAGIEAHPVILSTRDHGKVNIDYPFAHFLNSVIVLIIGESAFLSDATNNLLPFNKIPINCINGEGLMVHPEVASWVSLENSKQSLLKYIISINPDSNLKKSKVDITLQTTNYNAYHFRNKYNNDTTLIKEYFVKKLDEVNRIVTRNYNNISLPYSTTLRGKLENENIGNNLIIKPFANFAIEKNELTQRERNYPVDFQYSQKNVFESTIIIPEEYVIDKIPKPEFISNELLEISLEYLMENNKVNVKGHYNFKKAIYEPSDYKLLKYYMDLIVKRFNEELVFIKTTVHN